MQTQLAQSRSGSPLSTRTPAAVLAARTASTSYKDLLEPSALIRALTTGLMIEGFEPHVNHLLEEGPPGLLVRLVDEVASSSGLSRLAIWANMRKLARELGSVRAVLS